MAGRCTSPLCQLVRGRRSRILCRCQAQPPEQPPPAGRREARVPQQPVPSVEPCWSMLAPQTPIGIAQDLDRPSKYLEIGVAPTHPSRCLDVSIATQVGPLLEAVAVARAVVLVERLTPDEPQITSGNESSVAPQVVLRNHADVADDVEEAEQRLVRRLGSTVGQWCGLSQAPHATASSGKSVAELALADVTPPKCRVEDHHHVEKPEVASQRQEDVCRGHDRQPSHPLDGRLRCRAHDPELVSARAIPVVLSCELRQPRGQRRKPPLPDPGSGDMREPGAPVELRGEGVQRGIRVGIRWYVEAVRDRLPSPAPRTSLDVGKLMVHHVSVDLTGRGPPVTSWRLWNNGSDDHVVQISWLGITN